MVESETEYVIFESMNQAFWGAHKNRSSIYIYIFKYHPTPNPTSSDRSVPAHGSSSTEDLAESAKDWQEALQVLKDLPLCRLFTKILMLV